MDLNNPFKSKAKNKKYSVYVLDDKNIKRLIHFGDTRYEHYFDKIGLFSHMNHKDEGRRRNYLVRAKGIRDGQGRLTYKLKWSPNYWSVNYLW
jgi:hypothetical protein